MTRPMATKDGSARVSALCRTLSWSQVTDKRGKRTPIFELPGGTTAHWAPLRRGCATGAIRTVNATEAMKRGSLGQMAPSVKIINAHPTPLKHGGREGWAAHCRRQSSRHTTRHRRMIKRGVV